MIQTIAVVVAVVSLLFTVVMASFKNVHAYGRFVEALTVLKAEVHEMRNTLNNTLGRLGRLEVRDEVEREFSGRVRGGDGK